MLLSWWNYKVNKNYFTLGEMIFIKCLLGRLIIPRAMRVDKRALALRDIV